MSDWRYNGTSEYDITKRKQLGIPLSRKQKKAQKQRQTDRDRKEKELLRDVDTSNKEGNRLNIQSGETEIW